LAAAGTPANAIQKISQEIAEVVKHPELVKTFQAAVIDPVGSDPKKYAQAIMRENEAMARAAKVHHTPSGGLHPMTRRTLRWISAEPAVF
jgi:tripartite-type tricarboxylate transporter receptor subunit TctC